MNNCANTTAAAPRRVPDGFSLLELMLAITIMSMVLVSVYAAFSAGSKACRFGATRAQIFHSARIAMQDILNTIENVEFGDTNTAFIGVSQPGGLGGIGEDELEFAANTPPALLNGRWFVGPARVRYRIDHSSTTPTGKRAGPRLVKDVTRLDDPLFENAYTIELSPNVRGLSFLYLGERKYVREWNSELDQKLPEIVEVTMAVYEEQTDQTHLLRSAALIPSMRVRQGERIERPEPPQPPPPEQPPPDGAPRAARPSPRSPRAPRPLAPGHLRPALPPTKGDEL
ncbi:MAG: prepilin-type N-terminal cleavage/methylation domain-containing protein [bacterium]|nr:prepilin-type N-terminal cleavage/methylation domain-containing protein [bacterium]